MCAEIEELLSIEKSRSDDSVFVYDDGNDDVPKDNVRPIVETYMQHDFAFSEEQKRLFGLYLFSKLDIILLFAFTGRESDYINHALASPVINLNDHQAIIVNCFDETLAKIERYAGKYVYRMDTYSKGNEGKFLKLYSDNINRVINIPWFLSTTTSDNSWGVNIIWKIQLLNSSLTKARSVFPLVGNHGGELEIRFERNCKFLIKSICKIKGIYIVNMEEINSDDYDMDLTYNLTF